MDNPFSMIRFNLITSLFSILNQNDEDDIYFTLAKYCLEHLDELKKISVRQIEEACFASRSSVKRFFKDIGFDSLSALKETLPELEDHQRFYLKYANREDFGDFVARAVQEMMADVNEAVTEEMLDDLSQRIYDCKEMILVCSDCSSSSARSFQQSMVLLGRVVRLVTDSTAALKQLEKLDEKDLLLVSSVSGNYAHAIAESLTEVKAYKILLTHNSSAVLRKAYDEVIYLTMHPSAADSIQPWRSVYSQYAGTYLLDRLHSHYLRKFPEKAYFFSDQSRE